MFLAALDLLDRPWGGMRPQAKGEWEALVRRARRARGNVVLSHEILAGAKPAEAERALSDLSFAEVHVIYSARDVARQVAAEWQEQLKHQRKVTFKTFLKQIRETDQRQGTRWFWRVQGLPGVLERWGNGLAPAQVHVVTVPRPGGPPERAVAAVLHRARHRPGVGAPRGQPQQPLDRRGREHAAARGERAAQGGRAALRPVPRAGPPARRPRDPGRAAADAAGDAAAGRLRLGRGGRRRAGSTGSRARTSTWSATSRSCGPSGPPAGAEWRDPDRPRPRDVTSAAIDAIVALTLEAARRPDPDDTLTSRAAKLAGTCADDESRGRARAWAWIAQLRAGGTTPWRSWTATDASDQGRYLPGAQQLELLRRLNLAGRPRRRWWSGCSPRSAPGRGRPDLELVGVDEARRFGPPAVDPAELSDDELLRVATGLLAEDLAAARPCRQRPADRRGRRRPCRRTRYELAGDPWLASAARRSWSPTAGRPAAAAARCTCSAPTSARCWPHLDRRGVRHGRSRAGRLPGRLRGPAAAAPPGRPARRRRAVAAPGRTPAGSAWCSTSASCPGWSAYAASAPCPTCPRTPPSWPARSAAALSLLRPARRAGRAAVPRCCGRGWPGRPAALPDVPPEHRDWVEDAAFGLRQRLLRARYPVVGDPDGCCCRGWSGSGPSDVGRRPWRLAIGCCWPRRREEGT